MLENQRKELRSFANSGTGDKLCLQFALSTPTHYSSTLPACRPPCFVFSLTWGEEAKGLTTVVLTLCANAARCVALGA